MAGNNDYGTSLAERSLLDLVADMGKELGLLKAQNALLIQRLEVEKASFQELIDDRIDEEERVEQANWPDRHSRRADIIPF